MTTKSNLSADNTCSTCISGYVIKDNNECLKCAPTFCKTCANSNLNTCTGCVDGYNLSSTGTCIKTIATGDTCSVHKDNEYDKCATCVAGYYKDTTSELCISCGGNCTCVDKEKICSGCANNNNFFDGTALTCTICTAANCTKCNAKADTCETCNAGFFLKDGACTACPDNCDVCADATTCTTCKAKYSKYDLPTGVTQLSYCVACKSNCDECSIEALGVQKCTKCKAGNHLTAADGDSCSNKNCLTSSATACTNCNYGLKLVSGIAGCSDCLSDGSCPQSCSGGNGTTVIPPNITGNTTATTDSGSKIAFSMFVLAFFAILGHMMI